MDKNKSFRGKWGILNKWVYGCFVDYRNDNGVKEQVISDYNGTEYRIDIKTLGRCLNVTDDYDDKTDKEREVLYEGDIVDLFYDNKHYICEIVYELCGFMLVNNEFNDNYIWVTDLLKTDSDYGWLNGVVKIGNVHDNADLLESEE